MTKNSPTEHAGFTLVEVIIAAGIMIILCVGTLTVFTHTVRINRGNNLRAQAQSVLQQQVEFYRGLKFIPVGSDTALNAGLYTNLRTVNSSDGRAFYITVEIDNDPYTAGRQENAQVPDATCKFKEIKITAVPVVAETGWLANLDANVTIQRVRSN